MKTQQIIIGSDHAGFATKEYLKSKLAGKDVLIEDIGGHDPKAHDDYPDFAVKLSKIVAKNKKTVGILICGTGTGMVMAANKNRGIRAALIYDTYTAKMSRKDNDANVACLRGRGFSKEKALSIVKIFLKTPFSRIKRHERRIKKVGRIIKNA